MAWTYLVCSTDSTSSQESAESPLPWSPGSERSPIVRETHTLELSCFPGWRNLVCMSPPSGMTCGRCEEIFSPPSTLSSADSRARTSALRAMARAWTVSGRVFSSRSSVSSKKRALPSFFSKTSLRSVQEDLVALSAGWPSSGMIRAGRLYRPKALEPRTSETAGSSWLPTPTASSYGTCVGGAAGRSGKAGPSLDSKARAGLWPTPTVYGNNNTPKPGTARGTGLSTAVKTWPTPTSSMVSMGDMEQARYSGSSGRRPSYKDAGGGSLNPQWVAWLMGYPTDWTSLDVSVMPWFLSKRGKRSRR